MTPIYMGSSNVVRWDLMRRYTDDAYVSTATVTCTLKDAAGDALSGAENVSMPYVAGSSGRYEGVLPSTVALVLDTTYFLEITAISGGYTALRRVPVIAQYRGVD